MKIIKHLLTIITIALFIGSISLIFDYTRILSHKKINDVNTLKEQKIPKTSSKKEISKPEKSKEVVENDSSNVKNKIDESSSAFHLKNTKIPILMYHSISYEKGNTVRVPKENFRKQMKYLKENNYTTITVDELYIYMKTGKIIPNNPVVITFDDGYKDNYTNAYPILKELELKATVFIITNTIDTVKNYLTSNEIKTMDSNNIRIESHTAAHEHLDKISYSDNLKTMITSKSKLEKILGRKINYLAYPYGEYNEATIKAAKNSGYKLAFSTEYGWIDRKNNIYSLGRIFVNSDYNLEQFKAKLIYKN